MKYYDEEYNEKESDFLPDDFMMEFDYGIPANVVIDSMTDELRAQFHDFILEKRELAMQGNEGDNANNKWGAGAQNIECWKRLMDGWNHLTFNSYWIMPVTNWRVVIRIGREDGEFWTKVIVDMTCSEFVLEGVRKYYAEKRERKAERLKEENKRPLLRVRDVIEALSKIDPDYIVEISASYDCGYGWVGGIIENFGVDHREGTVFLENSED